jgi:hypothetical protein
MQLIFNFASVLRKFKTIIYTTIITLLSSSFPVYSNQDKKQQFEAVENFDHFDSKLPPGWFASRKDISMYSSVTEMGHHFLRVSTTGGCTSIGKQYHYSATDFPFLTWKWRIHKLPKGGNESIKDKNDSGAGIYVIFKGQLKMNTIIKYVWSSTLPKGAQTTSPYNSRTKIIVLRDHTDTPNKWLREEVNIYEDYQQIFGKKPPQIEGIGILSDADNTASEAIADYSEIGIIRE